jgi:hypothetical protein
MGRHGKRPKAAVTAAATPTTATPADSTGGPSSGRGAAEPAEVTSSPSSDKLTKRLERTSPTIVEEVLKAIKDGHASEIARETALNGKAASLLTACGLSVTVAFTFGGLLLGHPEFPHLLKSPLAYALPAAYVLALASGFVASWFATSALLIRASDHGLSESVILDDDVLQKADSWEFATTFSSAAGESRAEGANASLPPKTGTAIYQRNLASHLWQIRQTLVISNETRASQIRTGQQWFRVFLGSLTAIGLGLALITFQQQRALFANDRERAEGPPSGRVIVEHGATTLAHTQNPESPPHDGGYSP